MSKENIEKKIKDTFERVARKISAKGLTAEEWARKLGYRKIESELSKHNLCKMPEKPFDARTAMDYALQGGHWRIANILQDEISKRSDQRIKAHSALRRRQQSPK